MKMNASAESTQDMLYFAGDELAPGIHTVEFVVMDGDTPTVYKKAQYEIVGWVDVLKGYLESQDMAQLQGEPEEAQDTPDKAQR